MNRLTNQETIFIIAVAGLLVTGIFVKYYRATHAAAAPKTEAKIKMHEVNFDETVDKILATDARFTRDAYLFTREALDFTQKWISKENRGNLRHVTGVELLEGIRQYALQQFGPMTSTVFEEWGVRDCKDFGEIVFNMVEIGLLAKTERDTRADFQTGYDFTEAFQKPFQPQKKSRAEKSALVS